jgi:nucleotide-binding universal stress UspA family protein
MNALAKGRPRILLAVNGSKPSERAVRHAIALRAAGLEVELLLLNVQPERGPARSRDAKRERLRNYLDAHEEAIRSAKSLLARAGLPLRSALRVGPAAAGILKFARDERCDLIVIGALGRGAVPGLLFGSVAMKVLQLAEVPVTLVK